MNLFLKAGLFTALLLSAAQTIVAQKKPNIIVILADDMGFSDIGCYGGEVQTPNLDKLAKGGLRYKQFYNAARCCPTRASLMTGLYPHQAGMGWMAAADLGTPAYQDDLNKESVTIAEVLKSSGYSTYMTGKWHLTNERKIDGKVTDSWPHQRGFERYFGIVPGGANYFTPVLYSNNNTYRAPANFYLTSAISDTSVRYINEHMAQAKDKPFFMYVAYTAPHWPLHAYEKDIEKYKDIYLKGWDQFRMERFQRQKAMGLIPKDAVLSPRPDSLPSWDSLPEEKKKEMAMRMAIYAAQIDVMDQGIGNIVSTLKQQGILDNTMIFFLSDNGACAEFISSGKNKAPDGTKETFESYRVNWANLSSTPFREFKHHTHEGGIATPLIVHWPGGIPSSRNNSFVSDYGHLTDIMATCVEVAGAKYPAEFAGHNIKPMEGKSLIPHFTGSSNNRGKIFWEHEANIALRDGKWKMVARTTEGEHFDSRNIELYDMDSDPTEMNNLADRHPQLVNSMYGDWLEWAKKIGAFPLDTREYNTRMQAYRRKINGNFDDNLGGWNVKKTEGVDAYITIDSSGRMTGKNAALVEMNQAINKPASLQLNWPFHAQKGEQFCLALDASANRKTALIFRLEKAGADGIIVEEKKISLRPVASKYRLPSVKIPDDGNYRLSINLGTLVPGDKVWLDNVELKPLN